jgi:type I restriction enzyme S subunit
MNAPILLKHFDLISKAPDAIPRLRRFILDLAVRGKLVEQDPNDEPASELLEHFSLRAAKSSIKVDLPFDLPKGWAAIHFGNVFTLEYGDNLPADKRSNTGEFPVYGSNGVVGSHYACFVKSPCVVIGRKGSAGALNLSLNEGCCVTDVAYYCIPPQGLDLKFTFKMFYTLDLDSLGKGVKPGLSRKEVYELPIAIPPLAEQHRIVAKVDELMALCDQLQAAQTKRERNRDSLVAASLYRLNRPVDDEAASSPEAQHEHARFIFNHLPRLTTCPEHIKQLRQTILNLAVRGKLVLQDPNDEPASELLKRTKAEKSRLEQEGKVKKDKPLKPISQSEEPFNIPDHWKWIRLGELTELITKGSSPKWQGVTYSSKENGVLFITSENVGNYTLRKLEDLKYVDKRFNEIEPRSILNQGDILMNLVGASIGRTAVYNLHEIANINQAVALIRFVKVTANGCTPFFLHYFNSSEAIKIMLASQVVAAQPNLSLTNAREFPVPFPPLAEQHRIVAKVDELMALCDQLETQLASTSADSRRLLESVLHEALLPTGQTA